MFCLVNVELLEYSLQEALLDFQSDIRRKDLNVNLAYLATRKTLLYPTKQIENPTFNNVISSELAISKLQSIKESFGTIEVVIGESACGKTQYIRDTISNMNANILQIALNEQFSPKEISQLFHNSDKIAGVYFNISRYVDIYQAHEFFTNFFLFQVISDPKLGSLYVLPEKCNWKIFVEIPWSFGENYPENFTSDMFLSKIPVLLYLGTKKVINEYNFPLKIDYHALLVAKYLYAYETTVNPQLERTFAQYFLPSSPPDVQLQAYRSSQASKN